MPSRLIYGSADLFWFWIKNAKARHSRADRNGGGGVGNVLRVGVGMDSRLRGNDGFLCRWLLVWLLRFCAGQISGRRVGDLSPTR